MEALGPAPAAPTTQELIDKCGKAIIDVMRNELSEESDPDRVWILRQIHKNYLYYRNLQYFAPSFYQGLVDVTGTGGTNVQDNAGDRLYDYSQNIYLGYCRKLEAVLGNRMPNAIAVPDNPDDEQAVRATRSANSAAQYIRQKCDLQLQVLYLVFGLFNFGTNFWYIDWVVDEDKYGTKTVPDMQSQMQALGNASFNCPQCATAHPAEGENPTPPAACQNCGAPLDQSNYQPPTMANVPKPGVKMIPKGGLEITLHDGSEVEVPLDASCINDCDWLRLSREKHKGKLLKKWGDQLKDATNTETDDTVSSQYAENIRSAMGSPIGLVRTKRANRWTECDTWWKPTMYEMVDDAAIKQMLQQNFPSGVRITSARGKIVDLKEQKLAEHWQEVKPEPSKRIMADPLGNDWIETQDILTNILNQCNETIERSNEPGFGDPTRIDFDAYQNRRDTPAELFPALRPPGGSLSDIIYRPPPVMFSEQIAPYAQGLEERTKNISGLLDPIWGGGDAEEPTARQAELKKNAALMQLGVPWTMIGRSLEHLYAKVCKVLAENEDGVLAFSIKDRNQFGRYATMSVVVDDLRNGRYHFQADDAIPQTWGQQRDLMMWMLDKPAPLLTQWGLDDPMNIPEFKRLLGMPGERTPKEDDREKSMDVIAQLIADATPDEQGQARGPVQGPPGPPGPDGQPTPGQPQASIQPDWEDDHQFCAILAKAYLTANSDLKKSNPQAYQNVQLWGQAQENMANQPPPPVPPKSSVTVAFKGQDLGDPAVQAALVGANIIPQGTQVQAVPPSIKANGMMPPPMPAPVAPNQ